MPELSRDYRIKEQVLYHLIRVGLLPVHKRVGFREEQLVSDIDMQSFLQEYTTLGHKDFYSTPWAHQRLAECGVRAVVGPTIDGCRQYFYKNSDALDAAIATIRAKSAARRKVKPASASVAEGVVHAAS